MTIELTAVKPATTKKPAATRPQAPRLVEATPPVVHITPKMLIEWGYVAWRYLDDGEVMGIMPMTFGKGRVCSGLSTSGYEDCWCFPSIEDALIGMNGYNPETDDEPTGWHRHPMSGRRREDCDPTKEQRYF